MKVKFKTWGYEKILANKGEYCGKILHILKDLSTSFHYYQSKDETFYVQSGKVCIEVVDDLSDASGYAEIGVNACKPMKVILEEGSSFYVPPFRSYRIVALKDSTIFEVSTFHSEEDIVRLKSYDNKIK